MQNEAGVSLGCSTMALEKRRNKDFYYRKYRKGNRVISEYVGCGETAREAARLAQEARNKIKERSDVEKLEIEMLSKIDAEIDRTCNFLQEIVRGKLLIIGFHKHKGQWRKKRNES